jgi:hypothetical protein
MPSHGTNAANYITAHCEKAEKKTFDFVRVASLKGTAHKKTPSILDAGCTMKLLFADVKCISEFRNL